MASTPVINLRKGHAVRYNNDVCVVSEFELKTPPRMASFVQMSVRSITIGKALDKVPGVQGKQVDAKAATVTVVFDPGSTSVETVIQAITDAGFPAKVRADGG